MRTLRYGTVAMGLALGAFGAWGIGTAFAQDAPVRGDADVDALIEQLGARDFAVRESAEKQLVALGQRAVAALERAAQSPDAETVRRARRALARIRDRARPPIRGTERGAERGDDSLRDFWRDAFGGEDPFADLERLFEELDRDLERLRGGEGAQPRDPRGLLEDLLGGRRGRGARDPLAGLDKMLEELLRDGGGLFKPMDPAEQRRMQAEADKARERMRQLFGGADPDLERWMEQQRKAMDEQLRRLFGGQDPFGAMPDLDELFRRTRDQARQQPGGPRSTRSLSMSGDGSVSVVYRQGNTAIQVSKQADGRIRVKATQPDANGVSATQEWSAASEAELRAAHPEAAALYDRAMGGIQINPGGRLFGGADPRRRPTPTPRTESAAASTSTELGCAAQPLGSVLRAQLQIPEGQGLYLSRVEPGGWAADAGLRAHDVVLSVNGTSIRELAELVAEHAAASARAADERVLTLEIIRFGAKQTLTAQVK